MTDLGKPVSSKGNKALILQAAVQRYWRGQRIEIASLAFESGVGRATAYRWFGGNDRLLATVLVGRVEENFRDQMREHAGEVGRARVLAVVDGLIRHAASSERFAALLAREPKRVLKMVASDWHPVRRATVRLMESLLVEARVVDNDEDSATLSTVAAAIVTLLEAFLYAQVIVGESSSIETIMQYVAALVPQGLSPDHQPVGRDPEMSG